MSEPTRCAAGGLVHLLVGAVPRLYISACTRFVAVSSRDYGEVELSKRESRKVFPPATGTHEVLLTTN